MTPHPSEAHFGGGRHSSPTFLRQATRGGGRGFSSPGTSRSECRGVNSPPPLCQQITLERAAALSFNARC